VEQSLNVIKCDNTEFEDAKMDMNIGLACRKYVLIILVTNMYLGTGP